MSKKRKTKNKPGDFVDLEFDAVSGQYKQLVLERNGHPVCIQLWVKSHLSLLLFNCRFFCRFKSIQFSRVHRVAFYREHRIWIVLIYIYKSRGRYLLLDPPRKKLAWCHVVLRGYSLLYRLMGPEPGPYIVDMNRFLFYLFTIGFSIIERIISLPALYQSIFYYEQNYCEGWKKRHVIKSHKIKYWMLFN